MAFVPAPPTSTDTFAGMQASLAALEAESQAIRLAYAKRVQGDKSTGNTYGRHVKNYEKWWKSFQAKQRDNIPGWTTVPAFPIMAAKVTTFLEYECTREKVGFSLSLYRWLLSTELPRQTEIEGEQGHHTSLLCW